MNHVTIERLSISLFFIRVNISHKIVSATSPGHRQMLSCLIRNGVVCSVRQKITNQITLVFTLLSQSLLLILHIVTFFQVKRDGLAGLLTLLGLLMVVRESIEAREEPGSSLKFIWEKFTKSNARLKPKPMRDLTLHDMLINVHYGKWQEDYDTCYMVQEHKNREEFAIKNPASQIIKWAIVIERPHDHKVAKYQLDTEFDSPLCDCF